MAGSIAIRVPNAVGVIWRSSSANGSTGSRMASPAGGGEDAEGEVAGGLWDTDDGCRSGGDGNGERESSDAGEAVADPLGEQNVGGAADGGEPGEPQAGGIDVAVSR
jgi:hypothetical protein